MGKQRNAKKNRRKGKRQMRYIKIPEPVQVVGRDEDGKDTDEVEWTFSKWMSEYMLLDKKWGASTKDLFMASDIRTLLGKIEGDYFELTQAQWDKLKEVVESPTGGIIPFIGLQLVSMFRAVLDASEEDPCEKRADLDLVKAEDG